MQQIHADFEATVATFKKVEYDIMDVSRKEFDDDFYEFRCKIKNLEVCGEWWLRLLRCGGGTFRVDHGCPCLWL